MEQYLDTSATLTQPEMETEPSHIIPTTPPSYRKMLLDERAHFINNSRCKYICVGLSPYLNFTPAVIIGGGSRQILLNKSDWQQLLENQGIIYNYIYSDKTSDNPITSGDIKIYFSAFAKHPVVKLEDCSEEFITLGAESIDRLFKVGISERLLELELNNFSEFYYKIIKIVKEGSDYKTQIINVLKQLPAVENVHVMYEVLEKLYPRVTSDIQYANIKYTNIREEGLGRDCAKTRK